ncbi:interferon-induced GTP-binding protein Mx1 [Chaetomidium leptoderma]|uniref:Interferon-induced GTP-binding protein Mx1 n=1 Tax=Chaetomidium leptoderma TaxID=669021 RepID=A0AAN6ZU34_9PEZI|nr:interferon-induced GTP-binding protein Mx1 [Chaetomidium leptoderma]
MALVKDEDNLAALMGSPALLDKFDRLRDLNISNLVSLPQLVLVVVGDQSSGKSSVLESLTRFPFPRAPGLCTRYVTQITCRRVDQVSATISVIPGAGASAAHKEKLQAFHAETTNIRRESFARTFQEASAAMGIRGAEDGKCGGDKSLDTFSDDILKIEITGPTQFPLTVIDVPGIFLTATPGSTTENDIALVRAMVERATRMIEPFDIATQEILKLATDADPTGMRTMGVLTKPDLATERATQQVIIDLVEGKRHDLKLGYCVVKNRSADDDHSSLQERDDAEKVFFKSEPWSRLEGSGRTGISSLRERLSSLIQSITRTEFPRVRDERSYLAEVAKKFQDIVADALDAKYTRHQLFEDSEIKLITHIIESNEAFAAGFAIRGHKEHFQQEHNGSRSAKDGKPDSSLFPELNDILLDYNYICPKPKDNILGCIKEVYRSSRGPELSTERLVRSHTSVAIVRVHSFILKALIEACPDKRARNELWDIILLERLQRAYQKAIDHANFLLDVEYNGTSITLNHYFFDGLDQTRSNRYQGRIKSTATAASKRRNGRLSSNVDHVCRDVHDILRSYYSVSRKRFVDLVCQYVVYHFLLDSEGSPLRLFDTKLVLGLSDERLEAIAGEDAATVMERERLGLEVKRLKAAIQILRG